MDRRRARGSSCRGIRRPRARRARRPRGVARRPRAGEQRRGRSGDGGDRASRLDRPGRCRFAARGASRRYMDGRGARCAFASVHAPGRPSCPSAIRDAFGPGRCARAPDAVGSGDAILSLESVTTVFAVIVFAYFLLWNTSQFLMAGVAALFLRRYLYRRTPRNVALAARLASPPLVSVIVPARNEALTIVESVRAMLALDYEAREIVVVNDGSSDETLALLQRTFQLVAAPLAYEQPLKTAAVRGVYRSIDEPGLVVVDKESGGCKSDAANAGINAASGLLVLVIDADTMLEPDALTRAVLPFLEDPTTVAAGGYVAIANGSSIEGGRVTDVAMPRSWLARF